MQRDIIQQKLNKYVEKIRLHGSNRIYEQKIKVYSQFLQTGGVPGDNEIKLQDLADKQTKIVSGLTGLIQRLTAEKNNLQKMVDDLKVQLDANQQKIKDLETDVKNKDDRIKELEKELEKVLKENTDVGDLAEQRDFLQAQLDSLKAEKDELDDKLKRYIEEEERIRILLLGLETTTDKLQTLLDNNASS